MSVNGSTLISKTARLRRALPDEKPTVAARQTSRFVAETSVAPPPEVAGASRTARFGAWLTRPRRVLFLLGCVWVVSMFDLGYTLMEWHSPNFVELNPLAARLHDQPGHVLALFKLAFLGTGTVILLALRRHTVAELACWFLLATKVYLGVRWFAYWDCLVHGHSESFVMLQ